MTPGDIILVHINPNNDVEDSANFICSIIGQPTCQLAWDVPDELDNIANITDVDGSRSDLTIGPLQAAHVGRWTITCRCNGIRTNLTESSVLEVTGALSMHAHNYV